MLISYFTDVSNDKTIGIYFSSELKVLFTYEWEKNQQTPFY